MLSDRRSKTVLIEFAEDEDVPQDHDLVGAVQEGLQRHGYDAVRIELVAVEEEQQ